MNIESIIGKILSETHHIYLQSVARVADGQALLLRLHGKDQLAVNGALRERFVGEDRGEIRLCQLIHENRLALNRIFPYTAPRAFKSKTPTFGFGDRLGYANPMQLVALEGSGLLPVLAQQSMRELNLMGRTYEQVIDVASWAVFRQGWTKGFAADGDHLKTIEEVQIALDAGCTMITLDCSLALGHPPDQKPVRSHWAADYLQSKAVAELGMRYDDTLLCKLEQVYSGVVCLACDVVEKAIRPTNREVDFELSVDETAETTSPESHYYMVNELRKAGVEITSIAPRFVGEFHKAVDYIGNPDEFRSHLRRHARIADYFGHKISLHSGSEKYSIFPALTQETNGRCHTKTSGTSWLEAVECIAKKDAALYRDMHTKALATLDDAKKLYDVYCEPMRIPALDTMSDSEIPALLELSNGDSRQLMHITYGFIIADKNLNGRIHAFMKEYRDFYETEVIDLYRQHLELL